jgi:hypothetical protein
MGICTHDKMNPDSRANYLPGGTLLQSAKEFYRKRSQS